MSHLIMHYDMIQALKNFSSESLFNATSTLMSKLNIEIDRETAEAINVTDLYDGVIPQYFSDALQSIEHTYFIGIINDQSLKGTKTEESSKDTLQHADKYSGMFVFACDARPGFNLTRTTSSALTRAFNRISKANPVILIIRQQNLLSLATCERMDYSQTWRNGNGEKLGKVTILRNINCDKPHRGHVDILNSLGNKKFTTFEELYKYWMEIFSNELLTKKFYNELSDWYAWAVQIAKFPNDLQTEEDDAKYNHESCIRLITRLIFVWFLKQKHLIPEEFFDEKYIKENLIEEFDPHNKKSLLYDSEESKYYRLILQNLFFATLNCPIVEEGKDTPDNRRFRNPVTGSRNSDYNINNLMRYEKEFMAGGAEKFLQLANKVPFLNGGLFHCLDDKPRKLYYDGFSEKKESLEQLRIPDYFFFGNEVGEHFDLSEWYDDKKKKDASPKGIIDILSRYSFTIEENTPYDQEVSLDPELLGKVFENLLASYNPETRQSARKQTGSFYTPREIVQYMVDESLVAHLKRICGDEMELQYRQLLNYGSEDIELTSEQRKSIMSAIYNCRMLDPACGSGAFPMGILQQMVHILKQLDPTNKMWEELVKEKSLNEIKYAFEENLKNRAATPEEKENHDKELEERTKDIESSFNQSINDPDYARKLYLIENCIYGVDIQPIATQISKLRFFISLVVDQKPTDDAKKNFGIRPLPNLEAKFVTANTLIPLDKKVNLFYDNNIMEYEKKLQEISHRIFLAKRNKDKEKLRKKMEETRYNLAQAMNNQGTLGPNGFDQLMKWDMFDQNSSANFFDPEWMFGVKDGFDIVIANPPYVDYREIPEMNMTYIKSYKCMQNSQRPNFFIFFIEKSMNLLSKGGHLTFINPLSMLSTDSAYGIRNEIFKTGKLNWIVDVSYVKVFEMASTYVIIWNFSNNKVSNYTIRISRGNSITEFSESKIMIPSKNVIEDKTLKIPINENSILTGKISKSSIPLKQLAKLKWGTSMSGYGKLKIVESDYLRLDFNKRSQYRPIVQTADIKKYIIKWQREYIPSSIYSENIQNEFLKEKLLVGRLTKHIQACYDPFQNYVGKSTLITDIKIDIFYLLGLLNSKLSDFWYIYNFESTHMGGGYIRYDIPYLEQIPIKLDKKEFVKKISTLTKKIIELKTNNLDSNVQEDQLDNLVYHLYEMTYDEVLIIDPETPITRETYESFKID